MQKYTYHSHTSALNKYDGRNSAIEMISRAEELGFEAKRDLKQMCKSSYEYQKNNRK